ncbi:MAG: hypothetical protein IJA30_01685 [Bacilli bacterium]|nr:hypothetical protein [Bacilli bacterium]
MKKKMISFFKKNYIWLILLLILLIVAILFAFRGSIDKVVIKDHNLYQYTDGIKLEYTGEIMIDKETDEITQLSVKDIVMELGTDPIYYEDEMKVLFPKNMAVVFPLHGTQYKVNYYTTVYRDIDDIYIEDRSLKRTIKDAIIYDGGDIYLVVDKSTVTIGKEKIEVSPLSLVVANTQNKVAYVYNYDKDEFKEFKDLKDEVIISTDSYKVNASLDLMYYNEKSRLFIKSIDKLKNLEK